MHSYPSENTYSEKIAPATARLLGVMQEPLIVLNSDLAFVFANQAWLDCFGLPAEAVLGQSFLDLEKGLFQSPAWRVLLEEVLPESGEVKGYRADATFHSGNQTPFIVQAHIFQNPDTPEDLYLLSFRAEKAELISGEDHSPGNLQPVAADSEPTPSRFSSRSDDNEARFHAMVEHSKDIFIVTTPERLQYVSPNVESILGYTPEEFAHTLPESIIHDDDLPLRWDEIADPGSSLSVEYQVRHKNGSWRWIEAFGINLTGHPSIQGLVFNLRDITERKKGEEDIRQLHASLEGKIEARTRKLVQSKSLLRDAQRLSRIGSWELDIETGNVSWSEYLYELFGIDSGLPAPHFNDQQKIFDPRDWEMLTQLVGRAINQGEPYETELHIFRSDGTSRIIITKGQPYLDEKGQVIRLMGIVQDITERKRVELALKEVSDRLQLATRSASIGIYDWDISSNVLKWDETMFEIYGVSPDSFEGTFASWQKTIHPDDWAMTETAVQDAIAGVRDYDIVFRIFWEDGSLHYLKAYGIVQYNEESSPVRFVGINQDITPLKNAETVIADQRETFHLILEQTLAGYWDWDLKQKTEYYSPAFKQMLGYEDHELLNVPETWEQLVLQEDMPKVQEAFDQHVASKGVKPYHVEVRYHHKKGNIVTVISNGKVVEWDPEGLPVRMIGSHIDITSRIVTEVALQKKQKELEAFSYSVSHDLRAPLRGIDGWSLALQEDYAHQLDERGLEYLSRVRNETQRMGHLIDDLLKLSKLSRTSMKLEVVNMSDLFQQTANRLLPNFPNRNIELQIERNVFTPGDENLLEVMLTNLLGNALKFTGKNPDTLIAFGTQKRGGERVYFIRDNGVGFNLELATNLFGAFQRMHKQSEFPGTGIGLATVQRVVYMHNGRIWADTAVGKGATFYFTLNP